MTQQEQQEFQESLEEALCWMQAIQERLRANDNTQGPRDALEARLRETEKIHASEHEGRVKMDMMLVAAEVLLQSGDEELRNQTNAKLKDLKALWEETCTYIIHCHSRIEWVWLHWSEYLKAHEEFELWLARLQRSLDAGVELQLGVKEKLWQVDHQRVVVSDVHGQAPLLERLLDEAAALHNRTQDPSVEPQAQERLQEAYNDARDRAEERLVLLQKMAEEHQMYKSCVHMFQLWLLSKTEEVGRLVEKDDTAENRLNALQALDDNVANEEKTLQHIEGLAEAVRANTSPAGAEAVTEEAEELRLGWQRLRQGLYEAGEGLRSRLDSHSQYLTRCHRLGEDIGRLRALLQGLGRDLEEGRGAGDRGDRTEEQILGQWRKYMDVRNTLSAEESQVEHLKDQLKELFRFSQDSRHLSDDVLSVVKEHQSVKCRAVRLCSESESGLRLVLQDPLHMFAHWSQLVSQVLEASAEVTEFSHIAMLVQNIERLLKNSVQLQERLSLLQAKQGLLGSVFGSERSESLLGELSSAMRNRELLHSQLMQRKSRLQGLISRTKDFGDAYESIRCKLQALRDRVIAADGLQPDILAKKSQSDQLRVIQKDLEDCEAHITALETLVSSTPTNRTQFERLYADWRVLYKALRVKVNECEESIADHESFHESLLNVEKWLMIMKQKLESYRSPSGEWSVDNRQHEAERALGEFPEKELQLHQAEAQGQGVLERTSEEGRVHILRDMKRLRESWLALHDLSLNLYRLLNRSTDHPDQDLQSQRARGQAGDNTSLTEELLLGEGDIRLRGGTSGNHQRKGIPVGEGHGTWAFEASGSGRVGRLGRGEGGEGRPVGCGERGGGGGQGEWVQGHFEGSAEGQPIQIRQHVTHLGSSPPTTTTTAAKEGAGRSFGLEEAVGAGHVRSKASETYESSGEGSQGPIGNLSLQSGFSVVDGGWTGEWMDDIRSKGAGPAAVTAKVDYGLGSGASYREGGVETGERSGGERLGQGGGAFMPVGRDSAKLGLTPQSTPLQSSPLQSSLLQRGSLQSSPLQSTPLQSSPLQSSPLQSSPLQSGSLQSSPLQSSPLGGSGGLQGSVQHTTLLEGLLQMSTADFESRRREFEAWLSRENELLSGVLSTKGAVLSSKELKVRQDTLKALRTGVGWGQEQFQLLLLEGSRGPEAGADCSAGAGSVQASGPGVAEDVGLEELRYRWMLYKSKLKDVGDLRARLNVKGVRAKREKKAKPLKLQKSPGLLQRVCRVALPLWLLFLALILLAFLLPFMDEGASCSLANNFARSFNIMLRYDGPPPT